MNIYKIDRTDKIGWCEDYSFIVRASSEVEALITILNATHGPDGYDYEYEKETSHPYYDVGYKIRECKSLVKTKKYFKFEIIEKEGEANVILRASRGA